MLLIQEDIEELITLNASNTYPCLSEFDSWNNKSNVKSKCNTHIILILEGRCKEYGKYWQKKRYYYCHHVSDSVIVLSHIYHET